VRRSSRVIAIILYLAVAAFWPQLLRASTQRRCHTQFVVTQNFISPPAVQEKESRTPEQQKIDSQLLYALYQLRGQAEAKGTPTEEIKLRKDDKGRVLVDVRATVNKKLLGLIKNYGGKISSTSARYHSIIVYLALEKLEALARSRDVKFIMPAAEAVTN
jgi:hypothetical protein